ncbi:MAG: NAD-dependent succinate-semialdehyde dehydrogenase [Candidatus Atribacteria bacterium]|nr:NAD-dependent succinate-semialdehyde dehydrogenase [Candidatus Atribacteria bacterium]
MQYYHSFINGKWEEGEGFFEVINPSNGEVIAAVTKVKLYQMKDAINSAHAAFKIWSKKLAIERSRLLFKAAEKVRERAAEMGKLLAKEQGKAVKDAEREILGAADCLEYYACLGVNILGEVPPPNASNLRSIAIRQPIGVVFAVAAWNYPVSLISWKVAPALAAGCTVIVKPSRETPLSTIEFVRACNEAGLPSGVLNVVNGENALISNEIFSNPLVKLVALTGSTETGKEFIKASAYTVKRLMLELGGHSPFIVFADADLDRAVKDGVKRAFRNTGQICNSVNRIFVEKSVYDQFVKNFVEGTKKLRIGDPFEEPAPDCGPMVNQAGVKRMEEFIQDALSHGARIECGGKRLEGLKFNQGCYFEPTVVTNVTPAMKIMMDEPFGPIVAIDSFSSAEEAVIKANNTRYGLVAYVYTSNMKRASWVAENLDWGNVAINNISPDSLYAPYPGWKESGIGLELGHYGLDQYLEWKNIKIEV